jgi:hypothetical protein
MQEEFSTWVLYHSIDIAGLIVLILFSIMQINVVPEKLPPDKFKRIPRSYIVAVNKVKSVLDHKVKLFLC